MKLLALQTIKFANNIKWVHMMYWEIMQTYQRSKSNWLEKDVTSLIIYTNTLNCLIQLQNDYIIQ